MNQTCDLLLRGATLATGDAVVRDGWLAITGDRIAALGGATEPVPPAARTLELAGHVVTPGFVNVHTHGALTMVRGVAADLGFAPSYTRGGGRVTLRRRDRRRPARPERRGLRGLAREGERPSRGAVRRARCRYLLRAVSRAHRRRDAPPQRDRQHPCSSAQVGEFIAAEMKRWAKVVKDANIKVE